MTARRFIVARNPDPNSRLPYLIRVPLAEGPLLLKAGAPWPRTATVYCHRAAGHAADDLEILVDTRERYPYRFAGKQARTARRALPAGDYAVAADG
ncbi:MAG TPA: hypothetical protein VFA46_11110, partial [Actinomycetes bacterium]|nr:hypothetical protein [Actinomycetes bacterium]